MVASAAAHVASVDASAGGCIRWKKVGSRRRPMAPTNDRIPLAMTSSPTIVSMTREGAAFTGLSSFDHLAAQQELCERRRRNVAEQRDDERGDEVHGARVAHAERQHRQHAVDGD